MCKHVAAVLYGIGARFDHQPELLFRLRAVDEMELIGNAGKATPLAKQGPASGRLLGGEDLSELFGLDMAQSASPETRLAEPKGSKPKRRKQAASTPRRKRKAGGRKTRRPAEG